MEKEDQVSHSDLPPHVSPPASLLVLLYDFG